MRSSKGEEREKVSRGGSSGAKRALACIVLSTLTSSYGLLVSLGKNSQGKFDFDVTTIPFVSEIVKLVICILAVMFGDDGMSTIRAEAFGADRGRIFTFAVPGFLYLMKNFMDATSLKYIDAPTFQLLGNLKIVTTALCLRILLQKRLNDGKWAAVLLLCCSCSIQVSGDVDSFDARQLPGVVMVMLACLLSSLAGVYNEKLLKQFNTVGSSIFVNNIFLYGWGIAFNATIRMVVGGWTGVADVLQGYNTFAWLAVVNHALMGLTVSYVILHLDNLAKLFAGSMAMFSSTLLSGWLMQTDVTVLRCLTILSVSIATYFYGGSTGEMYCDDCITSVLTSCCTSSRLRVGGGDRGPTSRASDHV
ncbi:unnamed protein product [Choristocarpus tenellus]